MTNKTVEYVTKTTPDLGREQIERLKQIFPECVSEGQVDFDLLRATLGEADALAGENAYSFTWAGKQDAFRAIQTPSAASLAPAPEESVNWESTQHLFIEGENLEVLKLLYKSYYGRVKMIYIDPPYNTGHDFIYRDDYRQPRRAYLEKTGQIDAAGNVLTSNPETSGRYHSDWLSMMYPRLFLARQLLREDGVIFVSIDDHEVQNFRLLMNEIFGEENFVAQITVQSNPRGRQAERFVATVHEYVLIYARNADKCVIQGATLTTEQIKEFKHLDEEGRKYRLLGLRQRGSASRREDRPHMFFPIYVDPSTTGVSDTKSARFSVKVLPKKSTGEDGRWMWGPKTVRGNLERLEARLISTRDEWDIFVRDYLITDEGEQRTRKFKTIWDDKALNYQNGTRELKELLNTNQALVDYPKPTYLLKQIVAMAGGEPDDIYLDFFAGSCTTAQAVFELNSEDGGNRYFIMVQLPEPTPEGSPAQEAGYGTIADIGKERIRRVIAQMQAEREGQLPLETRETPEDLGFKVFKLAPSTFRHWQPPQDADPDALEQQLALFDGGLEPDADPRHAIYEVILKEGYSLNARIEPVEKTLKVSKTFRVCDEGDDEAFFYICLDDEIHQAALDALPLDKETTFICLDTALDDAQKVNLAMQCLLKVI